MSPRDGTGGFAGRIAMPGGEIHLPEGEPILGCRQRARSGFGRPLARQRAHAGEHGYGKHEAGGQGEIRSDPDANRPDAE